MADEQIYRLRKSKDGKLYQVFRPGGYTRPFFLSIEAFKLPVDIAAIRYGASARRPGFVAHRSGAFIFGEGDKQYWRQFVTVGDVDIATAGDSSEEQITEAAAAKDQRVLDFFAEAAPVRVEDAARALAVHNRDKIEAAASTPAQKAAVKPAAPAAASGH
jgi:hypothetical protein